MYNLLLVLLISFLGRQAIATRSLSSHPVLVPVSDDGWDGREKRRSLMSLVDLLDREHLLWNSAPESPENIFLNMTLSTGDDELVISMERFAHLLNQVNCSESMVMSFKSNSSYQDAAKSWDWVNLNENRTFILIANAPGCSIGESRQPWRVHWVEYDPKNLTMRLNATSSSWQEAARTYSMDFGHYSMPNTSKTSHSRRMDPDSDSQIKLDLNAKLPVDLLSSTEISNDWSVGIACVGCGFKGTITLAGHIEASSGQMNDFILTAIPTGVQANFNLKLTVSGGSSKLGYYPKPLDLITIPLAGLSVPGLFVLGPVLILGAGFGVTGLRGRAIIGSNVTATIPDSSVANIQVVADEETTSNAWVPQISATLPTINAQVTSNIEVYGSARIGIEFEVLGNGVEVSIQLRLPNVVIASTYPNLAGPCVKSEGSYRDSVALTVGVGVDLSLQGVIKELGTSTPFLNLSKFHLGAQRIQTVGCVGLGSPVKNQAGLAIGGSSLVINGSSPAASSAIAVTSRISSVASEISSVTRNSSATTSTISSSVTSRRIPVATGISPAKTKTMPFASKSITNSNDTVPQKSKPRPDKSEIILDKSETVSNMSEDVPNISEAVSNTNKAVPNTYKAVLHGSETASNTSETAPDTSKAVLPTSKTVPYTSKTVPNTSKSAFYTNKTIPFINSTSPFHHKRIQTRKKSLWQN